MENKVSWQEFKQKYLSERKLGFAIDISRMKLTPQFMAEMEPKLQKAYEAVKAIEKGAIANPDEKRMVGHYWLRDSSLAPNAQIKGEIDGALSAIKKFAADIHSGQIKPPKASKFEHLLVVGIGGSALGPQFVNMALSGANDPMDVYFFDNTDPDGMEKALAAIPDLAKTLVVVISKSGGTKETRNGQLVAKLALNAAGLPFAKQFVAVTGEGSELDKTATSEGWLARFPMWDWVGGRTSELSAVGLLPAALQGFDIDEILRGAREMDALTRSGTTAKNPAALMALSWYHAGGGKGTKDMVVLPYKDRLELFSRYLQQLLMESLGKDLDLDGKTVNQGIAVYGNKGSTDQHAYVQQLRDGVHNFFVVFIEGLRDASPKTVKGSLPKNFTAVAYDVEDGVTAGDYLSGFYLGTRKALFESSRESITITVDTVNDYTVGQLIALFERAVSIYAVLVNINAYHQPGVEAGKKAAAAVLTLQQQVVACLKKEGKALSIDEIAAHVGQREEAETIFKILRHLAANSRVEVVSAENIFDDKYLGI